jgi:ribosomal protein L12E/L44/L45/RPP1/RPP2
LDLGLEEVEGGTEEEEGIDAVVEELREELAGLTVSAAGATAATGLGASTEEETGLGETGEEERGKGRVEEEATDGLADIGAVLGAATGDEIVETEGGI